MVLPKPEPRAFVVLTAVFFLSVSILQQSSALAVKQVAASSASRYLLSRIRIEADANWFASPATFIDSFDGLWSSGVGEIQCIEINSGKCRFRLPSPEPGATVSFAGETGDGLVWLLWSQRRTLVALSDWEPGAVPSISYTRTEVSTAFTDAEGVLWIVDQDGLSSHKNGDWTPRLSPPPEIEQAHYLLPYRRSPATEFLKLDRDRVGKSPELPWEDTPELCSEVVYAEGSRSGTLWLATRRALVTVDPETNIWKIHELPDPSGTIYNLAVGEDERVWTYDSLGGLACFDPASGEWSVFDIRNAARSLEPELEAYSSIRGDIKVLNDRVFIGLLHGLIVVSADSGDIEAIDVANNDPSLCCLSLFSDSRGRLWITSRMSCCEIFRIEPSAG